MLIIDRTLLLNACLRYHLIREHLQTYVKVHKEIIANDINQRLQNTIDGIIDGQRVAAIRQRIDGRHVVITRPRNATQS